MIKSKPPRIDCAGWFFMCRKNLVNAAALVGFGAGLVVGIWLESQLFTLLVGMAAISGGIYLLSCRR